MPNPFLAPSDIGKSGLEVAEPVRLLNPLAVEESVLRPSLLPGLLAAAGYNYSHRNIGVKLFEIGAVFELGLTNSLPDETERLGALLANEEAFAAIDLLRELGSALKLSFEVRNQDGLPGMHPTRCAQVRLNGSVVGSVGEVDPDVLKSYEVEDRCAWLDLRLDFLVAGAIAADLAPYVPVMISLSDVSLKFVENQVQASEIEATLRKAIGEELQSVRLFDVFRNDQLESSSRSLAFSLRLQAKDRTMTDEEVGKLRQRCIDAVEGSHKATLRS